MEEALLASQETLPVTPVTEETLSVLGDDFLETYEFGGKLAHTIGADLSDDRDEKKTIRRRPKKRNGWPLPRVPAIGVRSSRK